jgi:ribosome-binding protein aMBF1 (putative translation factor)
MGAFDQYGSGRIVATESTRWSRRQISVSELTGLGTKHDRYAAIVVLAIDHGWSTSALANAFECSEQWIRKIVRDFRSEMKHRETGD